MARPKKPTDTKLQCAPLSLLPAVRKDAQELAAQEALSESEILREAVEAGLPLVPKRLKKRRAEEQRAAKRTPATTKSTAAKRSNVVQLHPQDPGSTLTPDPKNRQGQYGLRNRCSTD